MTARSDNSITWKQRAEAAEAERDNYKFQWKLEKANRNQVIPSAETGVDALKRKLEWASTMLKAFAEAQEEWVRDRKELTIQRDQYRDALDVHQMVLRQTDQQCDSIRQELEASVKEAFASGYQAGHNDTVDAQYCGDAVDRADDYWMETHLWSKP